MSRAQWRALWVAMFMVAAAALSHYGRPTIFLADKIGKPDLETLFPKEFGRWKVDSSWPIILPAPDVQAALNAIYNQVLSRTYVDPSGERIMLSVAYGGDQYDGTAAHRPEACYPAQGFSITFNQRSTQQLAHGSIGVRTLVAKQGRRNEPITYWVVVGNRIATTGVEQKLAQLRYGLRGIVADGMLVRVSSIDTDAPQAHRLQSAFIADLAAALPDQARSRVFGEPEP